MRKLGYVVLAVWLWALASLVHTVLFYVEHDQFKSSFFIVHLWRVLPVIFGISTGFAILANARSSLWAWCGLIASAIATWFAWTSGIYSLAVFRSLFSMEFIRVPFAMVDTFVVPGLAPVLLVASLYRLVAFWLPGGVRGGAKDVSAQN